MDGPISPPTEAGPLNGDLPAYVSNGVIGLRVRPQPLAAGMALVNGYAGLHPERLIEAAATAPYPLAGDVRLDGAWLSDAPDQVSDLEQDYDFASGELTSRFVFRAGDLTARVEVLTFCDRSQPWLVLQETTVEVGAACDLTLRAIIDASGVDGRPLRQMHGSPAEGGGFDAALLWESAGGPGRCGLAHATELLGAEVEKRCRPLERDTLITEFSFRASSGRRYRLRQMVGVVACVSHDQPDQQAARLLALSLDRGFETARKANRDHWRDIWRGRIVLAGAEPRWQAMADAALFYLATSTHVASPASTSIFGLATWHDYHYYYGHVMWDVDTFVTPVLSLLRPGAADSLLDYRFRHRDRAGANARLRGRRGLQFPWESAPGSGEECAPLPGSASWREDHVSLDVARAFAQHAWVTGDRLFLRERAWPVLSGVADWIVSRVTRGRDGYEIRDSMGIAERREGCDNPAFSNMSAVLVLRDALAAAGMLGLEAHPDWEKVADGMVLPRRGRAVISHDGFRVDEEKAGTPDPLMGLFPLGFPLEDADWKATLDLYLPLADGYVGSPMLSALYGVWAARGGDRRGALRMLDEGYGKFSTGRFGQILEYRPDVFPEQPRAGPFFANIGGFLSSLLLGFPGLEPSAGLVETWARRPVVLPQGWTAITVDSLQIHGRSTRLEARQGAEAAVLTPR